MGERSIRRDGKGGAILSQAFQLFQAGALAFFLQNMTGIGWKREDAKGAKIWEMLSV